MSRMDMVCDKFHFKIHVDAWCNKHCIPCTHMQIWRYLCLLIHTIKQQLISMSSNNTIQYRAPRLLVTKFLFKAFTVVFKNKPHSKLLIKISYTLYNRFISLRRKISLKTEEKQWNLPKNWQQ